MSACRSCGADVHWAITTGGKRMPVDAEPTPNGNLLLEKDDTGGWIVWPANTGADLPLHTSHFASCPNASHHRKGAAA